MYLMFGHIILSACSSWDICVLEEHLSLTSLMYIHDDTYIEENIDYSAELLQKGIQLMVKGRGCGSDKSPEG